MKKWILAIVLAFMGVIVIGLIIAGCLWIVIHFPKWLVIGWFSILVLVWFVGWIKTIHDEL